MDKKRLVRGIMRLLCAFIDYVLVMFPVQFVMLYVMQIELSSVDFLFRLLLAVYGLLMVEYNKGATLHDMAGNTKVIFRWEEEDLEDAEEAGS